MRGETSVRFQTRDAALQRLYDAAEAKARGNLRDFDGARVLTEGGGYEKLWLETQPMGGEMYAKRDLEAALKNQILFMRYQRADGRMPGSLMLENGRIIPQFNKFQGFCFPAPALNLYYWMGGDDDYLRMLHDALRDFDAYLWRVRDSDGDGCLESWCQCDTGEDHALRYGDAPFLWDQETPPEGCAVVPMASMDVMSYSYSARDTLAEISAILRNGEAARWREKALAVRRKMREYLWDDARGALFDRDRNGNRLPTLTHNTLRAMYWGAVDDDMAARFVREHLLNPDAFWTPMPLPSVAANDPLFRNNPNNDWSGQPEGLTYQRAIRALDNYGYLPIITLLGRKLFEAVSPDCVFTQQFDPFTMRPSRVPIPEQQNDAHPTRFQDGYGPTLLAALEYIARLYGVHMERGEIWWGMLGGTACEYAQLWQGREYRIENDGDMATARVDGRVAFRLGTGVRAVSDASGRLLRTQNIDPKKGGLA